RRTPSLRLWQRLVVVSVLIVATLISAALIYFQPGAGSHTSPDTAHPALVTETAPALPPGTTVYYYWAQHQPLSQQP
ncbi:MAG TPA: hypothetical protein VGJ87_14105, partial [Roseiflexaceae bacterium]